TSASEMSDDDELFLPRTVMLKVIKAALPDIRVSVEARDLITACCSEFIRMLAKNAQNICNQQQKRTISGEHVIQALKDAGFEEYVDEAESTLKDCVEVVATKKKKSHRLEHLGIPEEELLRQQQELFAKVSDKGGVDSEGQGGDTCQKEDACQKYAREEQAQEEMSQWQNIQDEVSKQLQAERQNEEDEDDYC
ncbi:unnamed protein product, partial [Cyprideis torosa]